MTTQEAYDKIREYFSHPEAEFGVGEDGSCEYISSEGRKCAVGCLIPHEILSDYGELLNNSGSLDGLQTGGVTDTGFVAFRDVPGLKDLLNGDDEEGRHKLAFLKAVQSSHDLIGGSGRGEREDMDTFLVSLDDLAAGYGLQIAVA